MPTPNMPANPEVSGEIRQAIVAALDVQASLRERREALRQAVLADDPQAVVKYARAYLGLDEEPRLQ